MEELLKIIRVLGNRDGFVFYHLLQVKHPTNRELAKLTGFSGRTVQRAVNSLVNAGYVLRSTRGRCRRLAPAPGLVTKKQFTIAREDIVRLSETYGPERVADAIRVLEMTYALSRVKPRCPVAILKAVLNRGRLHYPPGYIPPCKTSASAEAMRKFDALPLAEREARIRRAYTRLFYKTGDHAVALTRAEALAVLDLMAEGKP